MANLFSGIGNAVNAARAKAPNSLASTATPQLAAQSLASPAVANSINRRLATQPGGRLTYRPPTAAQPITQRPSTAVLSG